jgi:hypothetical protein
MAEVREVGTREHRRDLAQSGAFFERTHELQRRSFGSAGLLDDGWLSIFHH